MGNAESGRKTIAILVGGFAAILLTGYFLHHTFSALLTSLALAYLINPVLKYLERRGFDRFTALILLYGIAAFVSMVASFILIPYLIHQSENLITALPHYLQNLRKAMEEWKQQLAPYYAGDEGAWLLEQADYSLAQLSDSLSRTGIEHLKGLFFGLFDLVLAPILVGMILYYKEYFKTLIMRLIPRSERRNFKDLGRKINRALERFILSMLLDCLIVGILTAAALYFLGIEFPILNGLFAGFASIIPFLGVLVALIPAAFIGYAKSGDLAIIPKVCAAYFVINVIIEGNLIKPLLMRRTLKLNPLAAIFAVMALGELLGFWGVVLAIPLAAVVKICAGEVKNLIT